MGMAVGAIGMSLADWCTLSPDEFEAVCKSYNDRTTQQGQEEWERARTLALFVCQPYSKKKLTPSDIIRFPWDKKSTPTEMKKSVGPKLTKEEHFARIEELMKRL